MRQRGCGAFFAEKLSKKRFAFSELNISSSVEWRRFPSTIVPSPSVPEGAKRVVIAYPATYNDIEKIEDGNAFGTDILLSAFGGTYRTVSVEGANGYTGIDYKVYVCDSGVALSANTYTVKITS